jgi:hypothetical protein
MRLFGAAILAFAAMAVSATSAWAVPHFEREGGASVAGVVVTSENEGVSTLKAPGTTIKCTAESGSGVIETSTKVKEEKVTYTGCTGKAFSECSVHSPGAASGEIVLSELKARLGKVAKAEATSEVGLLLVPASGEAYVTVEGACIGKSTVTGTIAGEATPVEKFETSGKLVFKESSGKELIKEITVPKEANEAETELVKPELKAFSGTATLVATEKVSFTLEGAAVKVKVTKN